MYIVNKTTIKKVNKEHNQISFLVKLDVEKLQIIKLLKSVPSYEAASFQTIP